MPAMSLLLNVLWIVFGGLWMAAGWVLAAVIMAITIVGLPWARAALTLATPEERQEDVDAVPEWLRDFAAAAPSG